MVVKHEVAFTTFLNDIQEPGVPRLSPERFAAKLGYEHSYLAELAGVHPRTVSENGKSTRLQLFLRDAIRVIAAACDIGGNLDKALDWFRSEALDVFGNKTAERIVSEGRAADVLKYLATVEAGYTG